MRKIIKQQTAFSFIETMDRDQAEKVAGLKLDELFIPHYFPTAADGLEAVRPALQLIGEEEIYLIEVPLSEKDAGKYPHSTKWGLSILTPYVGWLGPVYCSRPNHYILQKNGLELFVPGETPERIEQKKLKGRR